VENIPDLQGRGIRLLNLNDDCKNGCGEQI